MGDIKNPGLLWAKLVLFVIAGSLAATSALVLFPSVRLALLMGLAIWSFCRAYYFAFYVIQHYIDPSYRFAGLWSVLLYLLRNRASPRTIT